MYVYRCGRCPALVSLANTAAHPSCERCLYVMDRVRDTETAVLALDPPARLPLDNMAQVLAPATVGSLKAAGILLPATQHALDWLWRHRATNGMAGAFLKVGGRRCIDLVAFAKLMREKRA